MSLRVVFLQRVKDVLYTNLKNNKMKDWSTSQVLNFSTLLINENKPKIEQYLNENKVTLDNINERVYEVVDKILIPSIKI